MCIADGVPFEIPDNWEWVRLSKIVYNRGQMTPANDFCYIDIGSIDNKHQKLSDEENIIAIDKAPSRARKIVDIGDILYSTVRPYLHNMCIIDRSFSHQPIASTGFAALTCHTGFYNEFLFYYLMSPVFDAYANDTDNAKGVAYPAINDNKLYKALIPVPPAAEQKRIVEKIKKVLPYVDAYRTAYAETESLNNSFTDRLKKSILQEAVQGKLVPQDLNDEPASILLERIRAEKQKLIAEGKIKKNRHESIIFRRDNSHYEKLDGIERCIDDEIPFEIPISWEWYRLGSLTELITKGSSPKWQGVSYTDKQNGILFITSENVGVEELLLSKEKYVGSEFNVMHPSSILRKGDLLTNIVGASIGRTAKYTLDILDANINQAVCIIRLVDLDLSEYLLKYLNSVVSIDMMTNKSVDSARANLSLTSVSNLLVPIPPLAEQKRIISKLKLNKIAARWPAKAVA